MPNFNISRPDKNARLYHRLITGLQIGQNQHKFMRFLTLTTATHSPRSVKKSFDILRKRIERAEPFYTKGKKKGQFKDGFQGFRFNKYFCLRTSEGNGVLHIVYHGNYIPQSWLSRTWEQIHGAFIVNIKMVYTKRKKVNGLVNYLITNYLQKQPIERMSYGWRWAWLGFCKSWIKTKQTYNAMRATGKPQKRFWHNYHNHSIDVWQQILWAPPPTTRQLKISKFIK